ncbi:MAG: MBL fold metallo-hydrolase [Oscillospiraceae bacterium]|nr:MBL fold metallo-hydrolase [Oscillospiraceae bacterium]
MKMRSLGAMGAFAVNSYLVWDEDKNAVLIDAPDGFEHICSAIDKGGYSLKMILLTHGHCDHIESAKRLSDKYGVPVYIHSADAAKLHNDDTNLSRFFGMPPIDPIDAPRTFEDGDVIECGDMAFEILHSPGHTSGSCCIIIDDVMFSGDTLFEGSMGRTDMPDGDRDTMLDTLAMLYDFDTFTNYKVYPGHGPDTTMFEERTSNECLRYAAMKAGFLRAPGDDR